MRQGLGARALASCGQTAQGWATGLEGEDTKAWAQPAPSLRCLAAPGRTRVDEGVVDRHNLHSGVQHGRAHHQAACGREAG